MPINPIHVSAGDDPIRDAAPGVASSNFVYISMPVDVYDHVATVIIDNVLYINLNFKRDTPL